jgi:stearoyl-CoA desaturase (Delta-9 desaturase)
MKTLIRKPKAKRIRPSITPAPTLQPRTKKLAAWLSDVPFIGLHLICLGVFFVAPDMISLLLCAALYFVRMFGITAGYHRYFAHRSYKTSRVFQFVLACLGCSALQKGPLWWAAHHRHHHRYSDMPEDTHSPKKGFWWSHIGWILSPKNDATNFHAVRDWSRYPELRLLNSFHWVPGIVLGTACFLIGGWSSLIWGFFLSTVLVFHGTFTVNSLCHIWGWRRYKTTDTSRNNLLIALITLGEGWHNNHHHYQSSANQGFFWWEIDISYYLIKMMGWARLVWDIRKPSQARLEA